MSRLLRGEIKQDAVEVVNGAFLEICSGGWMLMISRDESCGENGTRGAMRLWVTVDLVTPL